MKFKIYEVSTKESKAGKLDLKDTILARSKKEVKRYIESHSDSNGLSLINSDIIINKIGNVESHHLDTIPRTNTVYSLFVTVVHYNYHDQLIWTIAISMDQAERRMRDTLAQALEEDPECAAKYIDVENIIAIPLSEEDLYIIDYSDELELYPMIEEQLCSIATGNTNTDVYDIVAAPDGNFFKSVIIRDIHSEFEAAFFTAQYFLNADHDDDTEYFINVLSKTPNFKSAKMTIVIRDLVIYILSGGHKSVDRKEIKHTYN